MDFKVKLTIYLFTGIYFISCSESSNNDWKKVSKNIYVKYHSTNWEINNNEESSSITFNYSSDKELKIGQSAYFEFITPVQLAFVKLLDKSEKKKTFKLFLDGKFVGEFLSDQRISVNKKIKSFCLLIVKTGSERVIKGWDEEYKYANITDIFEKKASKQDIALDLEFKRKTRFFFSNGKRLNREYQAKRYLPDFLNNSFMLIIKARNRSLITEQTTDFKYNGSFFIHNLNADTKTKKRISEILYYGDWRLIGSRRNEIILDCSGTFFKNGPEDSLLYLENYRLRVFIDSLGILRSNSPISQVYMQIPDNMVINVKDINTDFLVNIPYATNNNITGVKLYSCNECYLRYQTIKDLLKAQNIFRKKGLRIKLLDCYRPFSVQKVLYDVFPVYGYVADPYGGSLHNRGTTVDLTLVDKNGVELDMGSAYDDLTEKSYQYYSALPDTVLKNRKLLREVMESCNFTTIRKEWWHYEHRNARRFKILDDKFPCYEEKITIND